MTANFLSVTCLDKVFSTPALAIILPLLLGSGLGWGPSRKCQAILEGLRNVHKEEAERVNANLQSNRWRMTTKR